MEKIKKVFAFIISGIMLVALAGCRFDISSLISSETAFTPAADSSPLSGTPKVEGEEITLPCTVKDLENQGFETDYIYDRGYVKMWHISEEQRGNTLNMYLCLENAQDYEQNDHISGDDTVVAIRFFQYDHIDFDLNGIRLWTSKEDVLKIAGTPAYEKKYPLKGYYFYLGDKDLIYRFEFMSTDRVEEILVGTKEYMTDEKGQLYMD